MRFSVLLLAIVAVACLSACRTPARTAYERDLDLICRAIGETGTSPGVDPELRLTMELDWARRNVRTPEAAAFLSQYIPGATDAWGGVLIDEAAEHRIEECALGRALVAAQPQPTPTPEADAAAAEVVAGERAVLRTCLPAGSKVTSARVMLLVVTRSGGIEKAVVAPGSKLPRASRSCLQEKIEALRLPPSEGYSSVLSVPLDF